MDSNRLRRIKRFWNNYYSHNFKMKVMDELKNEMKPWFHERWCRDNHRKYQQYFEPWFNNLTDSQLYYFRIQKNHIENGSLTNWITKK